MDYPCYNCFSHSTDCQKNCETYLAYLKQSSIEAEIEKLENNLNKPILTTINTTTPKLSTAEKLMWLVKHYSIQTYCGCTAPFFAKKIILHVENHQTLEFNANEFEDAITAAYKAVNEKKIEIKLKKQKKYKVGDIIKIKSELNNYSSFCGKYAEISEIYLICGVINYYCDTNTAVQAACIYLRAEDIEGKVKEEDIKNIKYYEWHEYNRQSPFQHSDRNTRTKNEYLKQLYEEVQG